MPVSQKMGGSNFGSTVNRTWETASVSTFIMHRIRSNAFSGTGLIFRDGGDYGPDSMLILGTLIIRYHWKEWK